MAQYFADLACLYQAKGMRRMEVFLDGNPTHKDKMQRAFASLTAELQIQTTFRFLPAYSPKLNLVEYAIHLIRQKVLHHADCKLSLEQFEAQIKQWCEGGKILSKEQIVNILAHIEKLALNL